MYAVVFDSEFVDEVPRDLHDQPVTGVVTPTQTVTPRARPALTARKIHMPTYAYACKECGHRFDTQQSFTDPTLTVCPVCGGELRKEYGSIGVTFNGSGFYRTDSRAGREEGIRLLVIGLARARRHRAARRVAGRLPASASSKSEAKASPASSGS